MALVQSVVRQQYSPVSVTAHIHCVLCSFAATPLLQLLIVPSVLYYSSFACMLKVLLPSCHIDTPDWQIQQRPDWLLHVKLSKASGSLFHTLCVTHCCNGSQYATCSPIWSKTHTFVCFSIGLPCVTTAQLHMLCCLPVHVAAQGICWGEEWQLHTLQCLKVSMDWLQQPDKTWQHAVGM